MATSLKTEYVDGKIVRSGVCSATGETYSVSLTERQVFEWRVCGLFIQNVAPELDADQREFLISGVTPAEWEQLFPKEG